MRTFEYRLYPTREQARLLMSCLIESRKLYNEMLAASAEHYQTIAVEKLAIENMVQNHHLAKSILDASWGAFLDILSAKAASAGHEVIRVNPCFTTQECSNCGELIQKSL